MHEYEALLFSDCRRLANSLQVPQLEPQLAEIRQAFETPEDINDSPETAPSKRIVALMESVSLRYDKPLYGFIALDDIGLPAVRAQCPHFDRWVRRLERRADASAATR